MPPYTSICQTKVVYAQLNFTNIAFIRGLE